MCRTSTQSLRWLCSERVIPFLTCCFCPTLCALFLSKWSLSFVTSRSILWQLDGALMEVTRNYTHTMYERILEAYRLLHGREAVHRVMGKLQVRTSYVLRKWMRRHVVFGWCFCITVAELLLYGFFVFVLSVILMWCSSSVCCVTSSITLSLLCLCRSATSSKPSTVTRAIFSFHT